MLFKPRWLKIIPNHLRPGKEAVRRLEQLRAQFNIPHNLFGLRVLSSPSSTIKAQMYSYKRFKLINPWATEKGLLMKVLEERLQTPPVTEMSREEIDKVMKNINSFEDLCDFVISIDELEPATPDPLGIGKKIDKILAEETIESSEKRNKNLALKTSKGEISMDIFLKKLNHLLQNELLQAEEPFNKILQLEYLTLFRKVNSITVLQKLEPKEAAAFCNALIRCGIGVAIVLFEFLENKRIKIKKPPYSKEAYETIFEKYSDEDLSKRCPCDWPFVKEVLDNVINTHVENLFIQRAWQDFSIDDINNIKEPFIKDFVYRGFSIGLESSNY